MSISDNQSTSSRIVNEVLDFEGGSVDEDLPEGNAAPDPNDLVGPGIESQKVFLFFISAGKSMTSSLFWYWITKMLNLSYLSTPFDCEKI